LCAIQDLETAKPVSGALGMGVACAAGVASEAWSYFNSDLIVYGNTGSELQIRQNIPSAFLSL
jgi:hypothetical protein